MQDNKKGATLNDVTPKSLTFGGYIKKPHPFYSVSLLTVSSLLIETSYAVLVTVSSSEILF